LSVWNSPDIVLPSMKMELWVTVSLKRPRGSKNCTSSSTSSASPTFLDCDSTAALAFSVIMPVISDADLDSSSFNDSSFLSSSVALSLDDDVLELAVLVRDERRDFTNVAGSPSVLCY
jgi:hypothetical protein